MRKRAEETTRWNIGPVPCDPVEHRAGSMGQDAEPVALFKHFPEQEMVDSGAPELPAREGVHRVTSCQTP